MNEQPYRPAPLDVEQPAPRWLAPSVAILGAATLLSAVMSILALRAQDACIAELEYGTHYEWTRPLGTSSWHVYSDADGLHFKGPHGHEVVFRDNEDEPFVSTPQSADASVFTATSGTVQWTPEVPYRKP